MVAVPIYQAQIANVFEIDRSVVTKHIGNVLKSKEVKEKSNVRKMHIGNSDRVLWLLGSNNGGFNG